MFKIINFKSRNWFFLGFISCILMLAMGFFLQFVMDLKPCPLCISQRIAILLLGIIFLIAAIHNPLETGTKIYARSGAIVALIGAFISTRHLWIQNMPENETPECGPGLDYIFENFPVFETFKLMLNGTGECAQVLWTFLGLSIPAWTLIAFIILAMVSLLSSSNGES